MSPSILNFNCLFLVPYLRDMLLFLWIILGFSTFFYIHIFQLYLLYSYLLCSKGYSFRKYNSVYGTNFKFLEYFYFFSCLNNLNRKLLILSISHNCHIFKVFLTMMGFFFFFTKMGSV